MSVLSPGDLITARKPKQSSEFYLAVYQPPLLFRAQINNASIAKGATDLTFDNVTGTTITLEPGHTVYVGTSEGASDVGRVRLRYVSGTTLIVAIDNHLDYKDNYWIEVRDYMEIWPMFSRVLVDDNNNKTYYKDWDIPYTNQNSNLMPVAVMGPHYAGFVDPTSRTKVLTLNATGSYVLDGSNIVSYGWTFTNSPGVIQTASGGTVVFTGTAGYHRVKVDVISDNGYTGTAYRHICLMDRPGTGPYSPILEWTFDEISSEWGNGGQAKVTVGRRATELDDGYTAIIFAEDVFNGVTGSVGFTDYPNSDHIVFVGYVNKADTWFDWQTSRTTFYLKGTVSQLQNKELYSITLEHNDNPTDWTLMRNMTLNKIVDHYFRWHTTLLNVQDYIPLPTAYDFYKRFEDITKGEIFTSVNNLLNARVLGRLVSDLQGRCYAEVNLNIYATGSRPNTAMTILDSDWAGQIKFNEIFEPPTSSILAGGVATSATNLTGTPYLSKAPGLYQAYSGKSESVSGLCFVDQDDLNRIAGNLFADKNNRYTDITTKLLNNFRQIDVIPQRYYKLTLTPARTNRNIDWTNLRFVPRKISIHQKDGAIDTDITWDSESFGPAGDSYIIPTDVPMTTEPDEPPAPPPEPGPTPPDGGELVYVATRTKIGRTRNWSAASPNYEDITGGIAAQIGTYGNILDFVLDPFDPINKAFVLLAGALFKTVNLNSSAPTWSLVATAANIVNAVAGVDYVITRIKTNITDNTFLAVRGYVDHTTSKTPVVSHTHDTGASWTKVQLAGYDDSNNSPTEGSYAFDIGQWDTDVMFTSAVVGSSGGKILRSSDGGHTFSTYTDVGGLFYGSISLHTPYTGNENERIVWFWGPRDNPDLYRYDSIRGLVDTGQAFTGAQYNVPLSIQAYTFDAQIVYALKRTGGADTDWSIIRTTNEGASFTTQVSGLRLPTSLGLWPFNSNNVYFCESNTIRYSTDGAVTLQNKNGDWATVMGAAFSNPAVIVPVWISG